MFIFWKVTVDLLPIMEKIDVILEVLEIWVSVFYWGYPYVYTWKYKENLNKIQKPKIANIAKSHEFFPWGLLNRL